MALLIFSRATNLPEGQSQASSIAFVWHQVTGLFRERPGSSAQVTETGAGIVLARREFETGPNYLASLFHICTASCLLGAVKLNFVVCSVAKGL